jgi:hypothetical protein
MIAPSKQDWGAFYAQLFFDDQVRLKAVNSLRDHDTSAKQTNKNAMKTDVPNRFRSSPVGIFLRLDCGHCTTILGRAIFLQIAPLTIPFRISAQRLKLWR